MLPAARQRRIVEVVSDRGECSVAELAAEMDCSKATIRRDLRTLADKQLIERSHGGAVPASAIGREETYGQKEVQHLEAKEAIATAAVEEIQPDQVVFFDSGSTTMEVITRAPTDEPFVAVTNSPLLAIEVGTEDVPVKLTGGSLRRPTRALVGPSAERFMDRMTFDLLFLGTNAIDPEAGLMTPNEEEARLKELMIENSRRTVLVADGSKLDERSFIRFADLGDIDAFYTDRRLSAEAREAFDTADVELIDGIDE
ncbi:HTH-type transcriptional regulator GlpR [Halalkalicoccus jeotgali]|uniref:DeoR-type DNA-binding transcriptional regulator n=1 Tax=Halalkalicoccus jeotgali (strain DSM 18796 / CECT 7217 / JCM 14584 / KCTC 4019 / B3) TaxID=795797 RepID=D8J428_HALJB|nr:HTH-type transcriptional regulator GlpR [Halalkalicoccus jeotgali]ADJ15420.1 DeoR-type DNA-binding transcriptional regulator [Halalkalicoccus jeotgali B3]ELY35804.1 DeoR-type DNA-binding transcriptional regulator [Halalkalicoccus jeotgali B3]